MNIQKLAKLIENELASTQRCPSLTEADYIALEFARRFMDAIAMGSDGIDAVLFASDWSEYKPQYHHVAAFLKGSGDLVSELAKVRNECIDGDLLERLVELRENRERTNITTVMK